MPIQLPIGAEDTFKGIIDLVEMKADVYYDDMGNDMRVEDIPEDMMELAQEYRTKLLDAVADLDDEIMDDSIWRARTMPTDDDPSAALRKATIANKMVPVTCGTSYRNKGVQKLLDAIVDYMPAPTDIPAIKGINPETGEEEDRHASRRRALLRSGVQDYDRPLCGQAVLLPRLLRHDQRRRHACYNSTKEQA